MDAQRTVVALAEMMDEFGLVEASLKVGDLRIGFVNEGHVASPAPSGPPNRPTAQPPTTGTPVPAPMSGIYYSAPSPTSDPFVRVGDTVQVGQPIALIEAMKVFSEVPSPASGVVKRVPLESGAVVEFGDPILVLA